MIGLAAVHSASQDQIIIAPGAYCRTQIESGAGVMALHPIQLIEDNLV